MRKDSFEIIPGLAFSLDEEKGMYELKILSKRTKQEIVAWNYEEIKRDPYSWLESLKVVAFAFRYGPSAVMERLKRKNNPKGDLCCNVCNISFRVTDDVYRFSDVLNGKEYFDFQCSPECHQIRKTNVYRDELGQEFIESWTKKIKNSGVNIKP